MEINRIEADRHLIGVGRELESLDGKAKATCHGRRVAVLQA